MTGTWSKLKKTLSFKTYNNGSTSQHSPSLPNTSNSRPSVDFSPNSSSSSCRFSRSLSSATHSSKLQKTCAICLEILKTGQGRAIFTAECSHSFHFSCITNSVSHGNHLCPICRTTWKEIPFQLSNVITDANNNAVGHAHIFPYHAPLEDYYNHVLRPPSPTRPQHLQYSDDEPLVPMPEDLILPTSRPHSNTITIKSFAEYPAVAASEPVSAFAVLVGVRGLSLLDDRHDVKRAPIDLVMVLDVSGSMTGSKLVLLKQAVCFVIENLRSSDRLSIVSFSETARRILPLRRMTDIGRKDARRAINSLSSNGGTDIVQGLRKGMWILADRRERNPVASIILLSDGKDTCCNNINCHRDRQDLVNAIFSNPPRILEHLNLLPIPLCPSNGETWNQGQQPIFPIHTFGFGKDHDSSVMLAISDASGGTFSFIESVGMVQDAFAMCIGGLFSVVAQELQLTVSSASSGVEIGSILSGKYTSEISDLGRQGVINVGNLYADEEKEFLVYLSIPLAAAEGKEGAEKTSLLKIYCSFLDIISKEMVQVEGKKVEIHRPEVLSPTDVIVSLAVDRQRNRLQVAEDIAKAQAMAEMGNLEAAQAVLMKTRSTLLSSASAQAGDGLCSWLEAELIEIIDRMASMETYEHTGRAYVLSGLSSHSWQRATIRGDSTILQRECGSSSNTGYVGYDTPSMVSMVSKSQNLRVNCQPEHVQRLNKGTSLIKM